MFSACPGEHGEVKSCMDKDCQQQLAKGGCGDGGQQDESAEIQELGGNVFGEVLEEDGESDLVKPGREVAEDQ